MSNVHDALKMIGKLEMVQKLRQRAEDELLSTAERSAAHHQISEITSKAMIEAARRASRSKSTAKFKFYKGAKIRI